MSFHRFPRIGLVLVIVALLSFALFLPILPLAHASSLNDALDCNNLTFTTSFYGTGAAWSVETTTVWYGGSAAKSGSCYSSDPSDLSYSYIDTSAYGPGHLYFWWKISSGSDSYLSLVGTGGPTGPLGTLASLSGPEQDWTLGDVYIPPGYHTLEWRYVQGVLGSGAGWLDAVTWLQTYPQLVVRGMDNRIYYRGYDLTSQAWGQWDVTPGATCDSPAAAVFENHLSGTYTDNQLNLVVRGMDGTSLWYGSEDLEDPRVGFSGWWQLDGATMSAPTLTTNGTGSSPSDVMCLVMRGLDNRVYYRVYDSIGGWGWERDWNVIPNGATCDSPAAAMLGDELNVVVRGMDGKSLWWTVIRVTDNTVIHPWKLIDGATPSRPVLVAAQDPSNPTVWPTMLYLAVRGMDNGIYERWWWTGGWNTWTHLPGATCDGPAAYWQWQGWADTGNYLHLVVRGLDGSTLWHISWGQDTIWSSIEGATQSAPTLAG